MGKPCIEELDVAFIDASTVSDRPTKRRWHLRDARW